MDSQKEAREFLDELERRWCVVAVARQANAQSSDDLFAFVALIVNRLPELLMLSRECLALRKELAALRSEP